MSKSTINEIIVFTDGSSRGNPGVGGWGTVVVRVDSENEDQSKVKEIGGKEDITTNNRMEINASIMAFSYILDSEQSDNFEIIINTDSSYLINGVTKWIHGWKKNGWMTSQREEVQNRDLWEKMDGLLAQFKSLDNIKVSWKYVGGHIGITGNERCDEIATGFALEKIKNTDLYDGVLGEYQIKNILDVTENNEVKKKKNKDRNRSKAQAFSYVSMIDNKIEIHKTWKECEDRVKGKSGARFKKALSKKEEGDIVKDFIK